MVGSWAVSLDVDLCSAKSALLPVAGSHARTQRVAFQPQPCRVEPRRSRASFAPVLGPPVFHVVPGGAHVSLEVGVELEPGDHVEVVGGQQVGK